MGSTISVPPPPRFPNSSATAWLNNYYTQNYGIYQKLGSAGHEVGHLLGLQHLSTGAKIMNAYSCGSQSRWCTFGVYYPQTDDINGFNAIY